MSNKRQIVNLPGLVHFVTFSTYQRRQFLSPERCRYIVMEALQTCLETHHAACHGFVIMPNHVHALVTVDRHSTISAFIQPWKKTSSYRIKRFYAQELTKYHDLCPGDCPVWQANSYIHPVDSNDKVNEKLEYMHNNPVQAGLVPFTRDWKWSSVRFFTEEESVGVSISPSL